MLAPKLIGIGRLGGQDKTGWHHVMIKPEYRSGFVRADDVYLIFESDRVFFVTISDRKQCDRKTWVRFAEDGIAEERKLQREVIVAIETENIDNDEIEDSVEAYSVVFNGTPLGYIKEIFYNGAQDVYVVETPVSIELLVPAVDFFIQQQVNDQKLIILQNMEDLLLANNLSIRDGVCCVCIEPDIDK